MKLCARDLLELFESLGVYKIDQESTEELIQNKYLIN